MALGHHHFRFGQTAPQVVGQKIDLGKERLMFEVGDHVTQKPASRLGLGSEDRYALLAMESLEERYAWVLDHLRNLQMRIDLLSPFRREDVDPRWN